MHGRTRRVLALAAIAVPVLALAFITSWPPAVSEPLPAPVPERVALHPDTPLPAPPGPAVTKTVELKRGDSFVLALAREGIDHQVGNLIAVALRESGVNLRRLRPSDTFEVALGFDGEPLEVRWERSPWLGYVVVANDGTWEVRRQEREPDVRLEPLKGQITRSLFQAVEDIGASPVIVFDFVSVFESDFDFTADTRSGDRFRMLVEKRYAGDTFVDYGRVLAAQYVSGGRTLTGIGFERNGRFAYYDLDGRSMRKTFLRAPLEFSRITSGFTYARPHPILGGRRPHLAIDYAAPVGTPVRAVADGVVFRAGWDGGYGRVVRLRHRSGYETLYAHLSRFGRGIRRGVRVSQRQVIGHVGTTGMSTGPHLHYEVIKRGHRVNPLSEKFLPGDPIPAGERAAFIEHARALVDQLDRDAPF